MPAGGLTTACQTAALTAARLTAPRVTGSAGARSALTAARMTTAGGATGPMATTAADDRDGQQRRQQPWLRRPAVGYLHTRAPDHGASLH